MDRGLLSSATSSDDAPTPGFQLNEIASKLRISIDLYQSIYRYPSDVMIHFIYIYKYINIYRIIISYKYPQINYLRIAFILLLILS